jgi:hypothetical protein
MDATSSEYATISSAQRAAAAVAAMSQCAWQSPTLSYYLCCAQGELEDRGTALSRAWDKAWALQLLLAGLSSSTHL